MFQLLIIDDSVNEFDLINLDDIDLIEANTVRNAAACTSGTNERK